MLSEVIFQLHHRCVILRYRGVVLRKRIGKSCILLDETSVVRNCVIVLNITLLVFAEHDQSGLRNIFIDLVVQLNGEGTLARDSESNGSCYSGG